MYVHTMAVNEIALAFYEQHGFVVEKVRLLAVRLGRKLLLCCLQSRKMRRRVGIPLPATRRGG